MKGLSRLFYNPKVQKTLRVLRTKSISAKTIRFSQTSVNDTRTIIKSMAESGWKGDAIDVVKMPDGKLTSIDNTRLIAAQMVGIKAKVVIHDYNEKIYDKVTKKRLSTEKGSPKTWGDAVDLRIAKQSSKYRKENPYGSKSLNYIKF